jgi:hypothetical protein
MTMTLLMEENPRSCIVCFLTLILSFLIQEQRKERNYILLFNNKIIALKKDEDVSYALLAIKFEEEVQSSESCIEKNNLQKIEIMCFIMIYHIFLVQKILFITMLCNKTISTRNWFFGCQKLPSYSICMEYMVEVCCNLLIFKNCVSFQDMVFTRGFT